MMNAKYIAYLLGVTLIVGCSGNHEDNHSDTILKKEIEPTQYKVLDIAMGMNKEILLKKGFDCSSMEYTGSCKIFTHPDAPKNSYKAINNNGTINGIETYLDKNNQIYKIVLTSTHTHNDSNIEQFRQTLSQLVDHNPSINETLEVMNSGYIQGAHFVSLSFTDKARLEAYKAQKENVASSAASDIKNFGK